MRLVRISVLNFRCLRDVTLSLDDVTAVIGANGTGKSSVIRALEWFFGQRDLDDQDVTGLAVDLDVAVEVTFGALSVQERADLQPWLAADGTLSVGRRWLRTESRGAQAWWSHRRQGPGFGGVRTAGNVGPTQLAYKSLRLAVSDLPVALTKKDMFAALDAWETANPEGMTDSAEDDNLGFGCSTDLAAYVEILVVPAQRDAAADASETRGSVLGRLADLLVRSRLDISADLEQLREDVQTRYAALLRDRGSAALDAGSAAITERMNRLAPGTGIRLSWDYRDPDVPAPSIYAEITESGFTSPIGRQGHGVQRAYVFALLQALLDARHEVSDPEHGSDESVRRPAVVLVVEEPELYQHPVRAQHLAEVLRTLPSVGPTQVLYATHSPIFVPLNELESVRLFRVSPDPDGVLVTSVATVDLTAAAARLTAASGAAGRQFNAASVRKDLATLLQTPLADALFAEAALLLEGDEDRGALNAVAEAIGLSFAAAGVAVVALGGKGNLDKAVVLLDQLGVPNFAVFDGDFPSTDGGTLALNRRLLALTDRPVTDHPATTDVGERSACARTTLLGEVASEFGATEMAAAFTSSATELGMRAKDRKNGVLVHLAVTTLYAEARTSATLEGIVRAAIELADVGGTRVAS